MRIVVVTPPAVEPLTVDDVRQFTRDTVATQDVDDVLEQLIQTAREQAQTELGRYLITQTLDLYLDRFPMQRLGAPMLLDRRSAHELDPFAILLPPLQSVTSITYVDGNGATQTLAADQYQVDAASKPARITPTYGVYWPSTRDQANAVTVRFVAGYGATAASVPACVKLWMAARVKTIFDNRDTVIASENRAVLMPNTYADSMLDPERVLGWISNPG